LQDPFFLLYSFSLILLALFVFTSGTDSFIFQIILMVSFIIAAGFRDVSVPDTPEYIYLFESYNYSLFDDQHIGQEFGFVFLGKLIKYFFDSSIFYFITITSINIFLIRSSLKNLNCNISLGLIAYISFYGLSFNFIFLRVGLAISLFIYCFSLIVTSNKFKAVFFIVIAPFFHKSIVLPIAALPILKLDIKRNLAIYILFICLVLYISGATDFLVFQVFEIIKSFGFFSKYLYYVENAKFDTGYSARYLMNLVIMLFILIFTTEFDEMKELVKLCLLGLLLTALFSVFLWVDRITDAFVVFNFIIVTMFACEKNEFGGLKSLNISIYFVFIISNCFFVSRILTKFIFNQII